MIQRITLIQLLNIQIMHHTVQEVEVAVITVVMVDIVRENRRSKSVNSFYDDQIESVGEKSMM